MADRIYSALGEKPVVRDTPFTVSDFQTAAHTFEDEYVIWHLCTTQSTPTSTDQSTNASRLDRSKDGLCNTVNSCKTLHHSNTYGSWLLDPQQRLSQT